MTRETCHDHSGCIRDLDNLKSDNLSQWAEINIMRTRMDNIMTRINAILGGVVVSAVLLLADIILKLV